MKKIIIVQHPQSEYHIKKLVGGWTALDLTEEGKKQVKQIGINLAAELAQNQYALYSSDLVRAQTTAEILAKYARSTPIYREELREMHCGIATNRTLEWYAQNKHQREASLPLVYHQSVEGAETGEELYNRVAKIAWEIDATEDSHILIVGHSGSVFMLVAAWLGMPIEVLEKIAFIGLPGGVSIMEERLDGSRVLNVWNDTSYMQHK